MSTSLTRDPVAHRPVSHFTRDAAVANELDTIIKLKSLLMGYKDLFFISSITMHRLFLFYQYPWFFS